MLNVLKIAFRNLVRYGRRTLLTSSLITLGVVAVLLFVGVSGSFKALMIGQFTDGMLGNLEVHRKGYVASIDNSPLNLNMQPALVKKVEQVLDKVPEIDTYSERLKFGAMFSNFTETTSIRVNGVDPAREAATVPLMPTRLIAGSKAPPLLKPGEILIPALLAQGLKVKVGDTVVLVATKLQGSTNPKTFVGLGVLEGASGPTKGDGHITLGGPRSLLRITRPQANDIESRLNSPQRTRTKNAQRNSHLCGAVNHQCHR